MTLEEFLQKLEREPQTITFEETQSIIDKYYTYTPTAFSNGSINNAAGENTGSCRLFAFAALHGLTQQQTLHCFGEHYRNVLENPSGTNHRNIRQFMQTGRESIRWSGTALKPRETRSHEGNKKQQRM